MAKEREDGEKKRMTSWDQRSSFVLPAAASGCLEGKPRWGLKRVKPHGSEGRKVCSPPTPHKG